MQETISFTKLQIYAYHGVFKEENSLGQLFEIDANIQIDTKFSNIQDDLTKTLNYATLIEGISSFFKNNRFSLLETCASELIVHLMTNFLSISTIELSIAKPHAPIPLSFDKIVVSMKEKWHDVYLSIGSNLGDSKKNIDLALKKIAQDSKIRLHKISSLKKTKPWGKVDQNDFLNMALHLKTLYSPEALLSKLKEIESNLGREKTEKWGPRIIDLDIIFYDEEILYTDILTIPHPYRNSRLFVLEPLCEINPYLIDPLEKVPVYKLLNALKGENIQ